MFINISTIAFFPFAVIRIQYIKNKKTKKGGGAISTTFLIKNKQTNKKWVARPKRHDPPK